MLPFLSLAFILAAPGAAETLNDKIDREYIQPVFQQIRAAFHGREPNWTPPILPVSARAAKLGAQARALWLEPLLNAEQNYVLNVAHYLASAQPSEPPAEPDFTSILPASLRGFVSTIERSFSPRPFADSTRLARGSGGTSQQLKLKAFRSRLVSTP